MIRAKTSIGFEFEIDERKARDQRIVDMMVLNSKMSKTEDPFERGELGVKAYTLIKDVVGEKIQQQLYNFLDEHYGYADADIFAKTLGEIIKICHDALDENERKNSVSSSAVLPQTRTPLSATSPKLTETSITERFPSPSPQPYVPGYERIAE
jgi:hypothetical protein